MATENATNRIPVTPSIHERLKEFRSGLNVSFDEAIELLLHLARREDEGDFEAGKRLRERLNEIQSEGD